METRFRKEPTNEINMHVTDESNNSSPSNPIPPITDFPITKLPDLVLGKISDYLPRKDAGRFVRIARNNRILTFFQPQIRKEKAKEAAEYVINPTKENIEKLTALLHTCPALLLYSATVENRHHMPIRGTAYQIALHESDNELIDDVIEPAFKRLNDGLKTMKVQRQAWLPEDWLEAETIACIDALAAIDQVFATFKTASRPDDVTQANTRLWPITIHNQEANLVLETFRKTIDTLYQVTDKEITGGRDPIVRLLEYFIDQYNENYQTLDGDNSPRNNALMRLCYGYLQRYAPINFMQAFAMGIYYIVEGKKTLTRSLEYNACEDHFILPLDSDVTDRLGFDHYASGQRNMSTNFQMVKNSYKPFYQSKTAALHPEPLETIGLSPLYNA